MQIISDGIIEEQPKHMTNQNPTTNNNSIPNSVKIEPDHDQQNSMKRHSFTSAVPRPGSTAPLFTSPENRSVKLAYSNGAVKNGRKRNLKDQVIVLENINLDSISQSSSSAHGSTKKQTVRRPTNMADPKLTFEKAPLNLNTAARPNTTSNNSEQISTDNYLSQQQECSSSHSDDNSILSPVEATECMIRTMGFANDNIKTETWQPWDESTLKSPPSSSVNVDEKPQISDILQENVSFEGDASLSQQSAVDPQNISLNESDTKKTNKASATKDPESGLTIDTVKRRRLCSRYDNLLASQGISHRLAEVPNLTNIQVAGLLRRSRNRPEMADISENVWNFVFEERRRVEDRSYSDNIITNKEFSKKLNSMKTDDAEEATDLSDIDESELDKNFVFEEVQNTNEEDNISHKILRSECEFYETRRYYFETDRWLCLLKRSLLERRSRAKQIAEQLTKKTTLQFIAPSFKSEEDPTQCCARCMPVRVLNRPKIVKQNVNNFDRKLESFDFMKQSEHLTNLDDDLSLCLEQLSLQFEEEDFSVLAVLPRPLQPDSRAVAENSSEQRRNETRDKVKKTTDRLGNVHHRGVGRPPKNRLGLKPSYDSYRKHLKRKASRDYRERLNSAEVAIVQENPSELKSFEEQLRRLSNSKAYVYSEIIVPEYRSFDLNSSVEKACERLVRKPSTESAENQTEAVAGSNVDGNGIYDPLFYAQIHHEIEFPKLSEEEIRKRRKEKWLTPIAEHVPFVPELYAHEDPRNIVLTYCMTNEKVQPFAARFHPGIISQPCQYIHREPKIIGINKFRQKAPTPNSQE